MKLRVMLFAFIVIIGGSLLYALRGVLWSTSSSESRDSTAQTEKKEQTQRNIPFFSQPSPSPTLPPVAPVKVLTGGTHVFQTFNNCGPASLSMAFSLYGVKVDQRTLGQSLRPYQNPQGDNDDKSTTLAELAQKAEEYGFVAYHRPAGDIDILEKFISNDMPVITRTWLKPNEDIGHYRVVKGYDRNRQTLLQDDSLQGKDLTYSHQDFLDLWQAFNYEFLVLVPEGKQEIAEIILGEELDERQAWQKALELADTQLQQQPSDIYAQFNRSVALYHLDRYDEAVAAFEKVQPRLPSRMLWYQIEPILAYYKLGNHDKVLAMTQQILNNHNRAFSELHSLRAEIYRLRGNASATDAADALARQYNTSTYWRSNL